MLNRFLEWTDQWSDVVINTIRLTIISVSLVILYSWLELNMTVTLSQLIAAVVTPFLYFVSVILIAGMMSRWNSNEDSRAVAALLASVFIPVTLAVTLYVFGLLEVTR